MPGARSATLATVLLGLLAAPLVAACGGSGAAGGPKIVLEASDDACTVARSTLPAGPVTFSVTNTGRKVTEVYVYAQQNGSFSKTVGEAEDIGPGVSRDLSVNLDKGTYEIACKPGQQGAGLRTKLTVEAAKA
ncbi:MAG: iron uptake system component EfeO [Actinomycetota bacterium]|jgi:iron uptake system component EfeO|nr:iron uptake system component EfeO [Actinomycetota bacterium]MDQ1643209.1 iron uptake system component EfeO [Actinomycetota bacterium]